MINPDSISDTIAAVATGYGGGIGIIRISGRLAFCILSKIFKPAGNLKISDAPTHTIHYGQITSDNELCDVALVSIMRAPKTYTGEDVAEISVHGSRFLLNKILGLCVQHGARHANRGEFTQRAFLNGKMDLTQAEAVCEVVNAGNQAESIAAMQTLKGCFAKKINNFKEQVLNLTAEYEAALDNPEENISQSSSINIIDTIDAVLNEACGIIGTFKLKGMLKNGLQAGIFGRVNAGKSSLLNALTSEEKAIVSHTPGTTRDIVESELVHNDVMLKLIDTAGIRHNTKNNIEKIGIGKARQAISKCDVVLFVVDTSRKLNRDDKLLAGIILEMKPAADIIIVASKSDLKSKILEADIYELLGNNRNIPIFKASSASGCGIKKMLNYLAKIAGSRLGSHAGDIIITNERQAGCLKKFVDSLKKSRELISTCGEDMLIASELRLALSALAELTGETTSQDIINRIFDKFCIGK